MLYHQGLFENNIKISPISWIGIVYVAKQNAFLDSERGFEGRWALTQCPFYSAPGVLAKLLN